MLRLEKRRCKEIAITLNPKHSKWNRKFWIISGIVLGFHLLLWLTIQIKPTYDPTNESSVQTSVSLIASPQVAPLGKNNKTFRNQMLPPPEAFPRLPEFANLRIEKFSAYIPSYADIQSFASIEEDYILNEELGHGLAPALAHTSPQSSTLFLSGPLAMRKILHADLPDSQSKEFYLVTYEVRVDNRTGKVFWFQQQKTQIPQVYLEQAEAILRTIQLNSISDEPITAGLIEIIV